MGGQVLITQGVNALSSDTKARIIDAIQKFDDFNEENDPYGTHEFGALEIGDQKVFWKVDAYDSHLEYGSPNPADPSVTTRVLTIPLASEY